MTGTVSSVGSPGETRDQPWKGKLDLPKVKVYDRHAVKATASLG